MNKEQKIYLRDFINNLPEDHTKQAAKLWIENIESNVSSSELEALQGLFEKHEKREQVQQFVTWVKGGVRPGHPH